MLRIVGLLLTAVLCLHAQDPKIETALARAALAKRAGNIAGADAIFRSTLDEAKSTNASPALIAKIENNWAVLCYERGDFDKAETHYLNALAAYEASQDFTSPRAITLINLGELYRVTGRLTEAVETMERSLALREKLYGPDHPLVANSLGSLAAAYYEIGRMDDSERCNTRILRMKAAEDNPLIRAAALHNRAEVLRVRKQIDRAEALHKEVLEIREKLLGPNHLDVALTLNNMGALYQDNGRHDLAVPVLERALAIRRSATSGPLTATAIVLNNLARSAWELGERDRAFELQLEANGIWEKATTKLNQNRAIGLNNLGEMYANMGQHAKADTLLREAISIWEQVAPEHDTYARCLTNLAALFYKQGKFNGAEKLLHRAIAIRERHRETNTRGLQETQMTLAQVYRAMKRFTDAQRLEKNWTQ
jgi:tetratricopeptide (TPR) repeat protein